jgi:hypothetical protein
MHTVWLARLEHQGISLAVARTRCWIPFHNPSEGLAEQERDLVWYTEVQVPPGGDDDEECAVV